MVKCGESLLTLCLRKKENAHVFSNFQQESLQSPFTTFHQLAIGGWLEAVVPDRAGQLFDIRPLAGQNKAAQQPGRPP
jgi:hypothetical protein